MLKLGLLCGVLAVSLMATAAHAAPLTFGVKAGMSMPTGDVGDLVDPGFAGGAYGDMWISPQMAIGADIVGNFFGGDGASLDIIQFGVHGMNKFNMEGGSFTPWIQYGLGAYNGQSTIESPLGDIEDSSTDLGIHGGAGVEFGRSPAMKFGVGFEYHNIFTDEESTAYYSIAARLTFGTTPTTQ